MYIVTVLPIARAISKDTLTYFSKEEIEEGAIVSVPLRKKSISGIVLKCQKAEELRSELKNLPYQLKKMRVETKGSFFAPAFMEAVNKASEYFCATPGAIIAGLVPKVLFEIKETIGENESIKQKKSPAEGGRRAVPHFEELAIQTDILERIDIYKSIIREAFAKKESVFVCLPTEESARKTLEKLKKGIEEYSVLFIGSLTGKKLKEVLKKIKESEHSLLVVGTASYSPLIREDTRTIIVEEESGRYYKQATRPYLDLRIFLRFFAKFSKVKIIYADTLLRVETLHRVYEGEVAEYSRIMTKRHKNIPTLVINMKKDIEKEETNENTGKNNSEKPLPELAGKKFEVLCTELKEMITYALKHKKSIFLFSARRGVSSETVCRDCGTTVFCDKCEAPVVLHKQSEGMNFICHHCGAQRSAEELCKVCGSWRLESYGLGIEKIIEELKNFTNKEKQQEIFRIDSDSCKTADTARKVIAKFETKKGILVGTEMALQYLEEKSVNYSAIVSIDSLFSLPDFRIEERIMHIILGVKAVAEENFLLQGRNVDSPVVEQGVAGDLVGFAKNEISARKRFEYPPFTTLVKITVSGEKSKVRDETEEIATLLEEYSPTIFPAFIKTIKGKVMTHLLIKIPTNKWPDRDLREKLISLSPSVAIRVDPESLL